MKTITVLLVEEHMIVREGFRMMPERDTGLHVLGEAQDGRQAVVMVEKLHPDVVLIDIAMPRLNGLEATRQVLKAHPEIKVLILSAQNDDAYINGAIGDGAMGFLLKQTSTSDVCKAIREVYLGNTFFSHSISRRLGRLDSHPQKQASFGKTAAPLISRNVEVLQLIAEGKANKETASELDISIKTLEKHRGNLMAKLDIHDTAGLTRYAIAAGIIESSVQVTIL